MIINIAGAGAGKTTKLSKKIIDYYSAQSNEKNIYCITYTNNAMFSIKEKLKEYFDIIPSNIKISTIHSFMYQEIIKPYYYLLFGVNFSKISTITLDSNHRWKNKKLAELNIKGIIHQSEFSQKANGLYVKKALIKRRRER